jgi:Raf kinase inhibitor-like YbhB/YbcL family protein
MIQRLVGLSILSIAIALAVVPVGDAQTKPAPPPGGAPGQPGGRGGGGPRRGPIQVMTFGSSAWADGGMIPAKHTQVGGEASPPFTWGNVPEGTASFVLIAHDIDAATGNGLDDTLHWLVWNIPGTATGLPENVPKTAQLPDGSRQISATAPGYRGPGAAAAGPAHHYVFELYALDTVLDVPAVGQTPALTRAAVLAAMAGHVRGKAAYVGLFRR